MTPPLPPQICYTFIHSYNLLSLCVCVSCICVATSVTRRRRRGVCQTQTEAQNEVVLARGIVAKWLAFWLQGIAGTQDPLWGRSNLGRAFWNVSIKFDCLAIICCWLAASWQLGAGFNHFNLSLILWHYLWASCKGPARICAQLLQLLFRLWRLPAAIYGKSFANKAKVVRSLRLWWRETNWKIDLRFVYYGSFNTQELSVSCSFECTIKVLTFISVIV